MEITVLRLQALIKGRGAAPSKASDVRLCWKKSIEKVAGSRSRGAPLEMPADCRRRLAGIIYLIKYA